MCIINSNPVPLPLSHHIGPVSPSGADTVTTAEDDLTILSEGERHEQLLAAATTSKLAPNMFLLPHTSGFYCSSSSDASDDTDATDLLLLALSKDDCCSSEDVLLFPADSSVPPIAARSNCPVYPVSSSSSSMSSTSLSFRRQVSDIALSSSAMSSPQSSAANTSPITTPRERPVLLPPTAATPNRKRERETPLPLSPSRPLSPTSCASPSVRRCISPRDFHLHSEREGDVEMVHAEEVVEVVSMPVPTDSLPVPSLVSLPLHRSTWEREREKERTLDVLFLLYEKAEEQVHNRNQLSCTRFLRDGFVDISLRDTNDVSRVIELFLLTDAELGHDKMVMYVGHATQYCDLLCGKQSTLSQDRLVSLLQQHAPGRCESDGGDKRVSQSRKLFLAFLCANVDFYGENRQNHVAMAQCLSGGLRQGEGASDVEILWDRTKQRSPSVVSNRRDFDCYRHIEDVLNRYHHVRFYED